MKKNNKANKIVVLSIIGVLLLVCLIVFILNYTKDSSSFSLLEKNWINNHKNGVVDVSVYNDVPIYGEDGEGIIFSFLEEFTNSYDIQFNKVSYLQNNNNNLKNVSFRILDYSTTLSDNDILMYHDYYVIVSKDNNSINEITELTNQSVGVLDSDISNVRYFLNDADGIKFTSCKDISEMISYLEDDTISYMVVPNNLYLDDTLFR